MPITAREVWRDYEADGIPSSGAHKIAKPDLRAWGAWVEAFIAAGLSSGSSAIYDTQANLSANLVWIANSLAWVVADPDVAKNGIYRKIGGSGTGSWGRVADLPYSFIVATDVGAGSPNAIQAATPIPVSESALILLNIFEDNTASPVTVSFNGGAALTVKSNSGNDIAPGGLKAGMLVMGRVSGSTFRLVSDQVSAAIVAAAEAAQAAAEAARDIALSAVPGAFPATLAALKALPTATITSAFLKEAEKEGQFALMSGDYSSQVAADGFGLYVKADDQAATSAAWVRPEARPKTVKEWKAAWFGVWDHASSDQTGFLQKIVDTAKLTPGDPTEVLFPIGTVVVNAGGTNTPIELDGVSNLTFTGRRGTVLKKTVIQRELFYGGRTTKCSNLKFRGFDLDGGNLDDTDNNWPMLMVAWGDDITFEDIFAINCSSGLRVGNATNISLRPKVRNCRVVNPRYNGIELFYFNNGDAEKNSVEGGAQSTGVSSRGIRILKGYRCGVRKNSISNVGGGVALNTDATRANEYIWVEDNDILGCNAIAAIWSQYAVINSRISRNTIKCAGAPSGIHIGYIETGVPTRSNNLEISDNVVEAGASEADLIRIYGADNLDISGNRLRHLGRALTTTHYAARTISCGGKNFIQGNKIEMDDADGRGIYDVSGISGAQFVAGDNKFMMPSGAIANALQQSGSSATLIKGGSVGDTNAYVTRT